MDQPVIHMSDLGPLLGVKASTAPATIRRLQRQHNFPHALPGLPARFSRVAVETWLASNGGMTAATAAAEADAIAIHRAQLERSYGVSP